MIERNCPNFDASYVQCLSLDLENRNTRRLMLSAFISYLSILLSTKKFCRTSLPDFLKHVSKVNKIEHIKIIDLNINTM